jgi:AcrR family transcriptional regulator
MGRPKNFDRIEVLKKAMPLFWERGFTDTGLQDLEKVTGLNKSSLYAEFKNKEALFLESLRYYVDSREGRELLSVEPLGWDNIEKFLKLRQNPMHSNKGCFAVNCMREMPILPVEAQTIIFESRARLKKLFAKNIEAASPQMPVETLVEVLSTFFSGLAIELNVKANKAANLRKIEDFIRVMRLS